MVHLNMQHRGMGIVVRAALGDSGIPSRSLAAWDRASASSRAVLG